MSKIKKTEAIVLRKIEFGETSYIIHLFSLDQGKISVLAKGARRQKSKWGNVIDSFNVIEAIYYEKETREIQILTNAELIYKPENIPTKIEKFIQASVCSELVYRCLVDGYTNQKIYEALKKAVKIINERDSTNYDIPLRFALFFLKEMGYEFELNNCADCSKEINDEQIIYYSLIDRALCRQCFSKRNIKPDLILDKELFSLIICLKKRDKEIYISKEIFIKLMYFFEKYINFHMREGKIFHSINLLQ